MKYPLYTFFFLLSLLIAQPLLGQFEDNFDSGTLLENGWTGDLNNFILNPDAQLQLMDLDPESSNESILGQSLTTGDSTSWEFWCRMDFSPSAANFTEVILALDVPSLSTGNGYVIRIGGISGDQDAVGLYKKTGSQYQMLAEGMPGAVGGSEVIVRVRVIRNAEGLWELWVDYSGGADYVLEGEVLDDTFPIGNYFAFSCTYSSTRADKFFFDDLLIGPDYVDLIPPAIIESQVDENGDLLLTFSESLDETSITNNSNYQFSPALSFESPELSSGLPNQVFIDITTPLTSGQNYELALSNIEDLFGNLMADTTLNFEFLEIAQAQPFDILITEIMADPSPSVGLPEYEYIELWNRSDVYFQLSDIRLEDGFGNTSLPSYILEPDQYITLTSTDAIDLLLLPNTLGVPGFPSLTNDGENLTLKSISGELINSVDYSSTWYQDIERDDGGYSLEMISTNRLCEGKGNWRASVADIGGTPGLVNANNDVNGISVVPAIDNALSINSTTILIFFTQSISENYLNNTSNYTLDGYSVTSASSSDNGQTVSLELSDELMPNEVVELILTAPINNCTEEEFNVELSWQIGLPTAVEIGDLLINEILFNPISGSKDYIELYNNSDKIVDLGELFFGARDEMGNLSDVEALPENLYLFPKSYMAFTEDPDDVNTNYPDAARPGKIIMSSLPPMADKEGILVLYKEDFPDVTILEEFAYSDDYHNPLLTDENGVALERLSFTTPSNQSNNWTSAAGSAGFGTPAAPNSKFINPAAETTDFIDGTLRLSPDDDGFEDFLSLTYRDDGTEAFAISLRIYNAAGQLIKVLANNQTVGSEAFFKWEGDTNTGDKAPIGLYILWAERFSPTGTVERLKKSIVVATYLD